MLNHATSLTDTVLSVRRLQLVSHYLGGGEAISGAMIRSTGTCNKNKQTLKKDHSRALIMS